MKLLLTLISILVVCIALSSAAVFHGFSKDPEHPDKCVMKEINLILSPGDKVRHPNSCIRLMCYNNNLIVGHSCGLFAPPDGCILGQPLDADAPYPECCHREIICNTIE